MLRSLREYNFSQSIHLVLSESSFVRNFHQILSILVKGRVLDRDTWMLTRSCNNAGCAQTQRWLEVGWMIKMLIEAKWRVCPELCSSRCLQQEWWPCSAGYGKSRLLSHNQLAVRVLRFGQLPNFAGYFVLWNVHGFWNAERSISVWDHIEFFKNKTRILNAIRIIKIGFEWLWAGYKLLNDYGQSGQFLRMMPFLCDDSKENCFL